MKTIVFVEDDEIVRENFSELLAAEGFSVMPFCTAEDALSSMKRAMPDLTLLDIKLGHDTQAGFDLCLELRKLSPTLPIVFFTSRDSDIDKISGMRMGADDYITKDASMEYLVVRIKALLRRVEILSSGALMPRRTVTRGDLTLDLDGLYASWKGIPLNFTLTHFWLIHALAEHPGHVKTHDQLMRAAKIRVEPNTISAHIKNIRQQFLRTDPAFACIKTDRALGYRWATASSEESAP